MTTEIGNKEIQSQDENQPLIHESKKPALTFVIQSWTTLIFGIIMLATGLFAGYYGRPLLSPDTISVAV